MSFLVRSVPQTAARATITSLSCSVQQLAMRVPLMHAVAAASSDSSIRSVSSGSLNLGSFKDPAEYSID